jgi:hypothetical protein
MSGDTLSWGGTMLIVGVVLMIVLAGWSLVSFMYAPMYAGDQRKAKERQQSNRDVHDAITSVLQPGASHRHRRTQ